MIPAELDRRLKNFKASLRSKFANRRRGRSNLLPHQRRTLCWLRQQQELMVVQCDKNLGPAIIERDEYIRFAFKDHLNDTRTYQRIHPNQVQSRRDHLHKLLDKWIKKYKAVLSKRERAFLLAKKKANTEPFAHLYLTMKVHKTPLTTRPIVSCSGSLLEGLGIWVDDKLKQAAVTMRSYIKSSYDLKTELIQQDLPPNCRLFTADAQSMYTNIPTEFALATIGTWLRANHNRFPNLPLDATIAGLKFIMRHNCFIFGDTYWKQLKGTAMGTPPAPNYATLYYGILEEELLENPRFTANLRLYGRYIDDVFGIWHITDPSTNDRTWRAFKKQMNNRQFGLKWDHTPLSETVNFLDITISIQSDNRINTTLYEKASNLHLYIPSHSAHPPGLIRGIVYGNIFRIHTLCSDEKDCLAKTRMFFHRLLARGYQRKDITPLFQSAIQRAKSYTGPKPKAAKDVMGFMLLHLQYHPKNPPGKELQKAWQDHIANPDPPYGKPLKKIRIPHTGNPPSRVGRTEMGIDRMVIAYSRAPNLGNLLSYRKLPSDSGPPASSFANE